MKDSVYTMTVDLRDAAAMAVYKGRAYYFCSAEYKKQFIDDPKKYQDIVKAERLSIGVMGSAGSSESQESRLQAKVLGKVIAEDGLVLITGACPGLPYESALGARSEGGAL
jgi:YHS domain-containing protein